MTVWNTIPQNPIWQYDSDPPDPGGAQTALWQTGTNGIRTTSRGTEIYMNVQHRIFNSGRASRPNEMSKSFFDAKGTHLPENSIRTGGLSTIAGLNITWDSNNRGIRIIKTAQTPTNKSAFLFHSKMTSANGGSYGAGHYKVYFNVTQNSGEDIGADPNSNIQHGHNKPVFLSTRDDDNVVETPDYNNKEYHMITQGFNVFDVELFDDNDARPPAIALVIHKSGGHPFDITISDINVVYVG